MLFLLSVHQHALLAPIANLDGIQIQPGAKFVQDVLKEHTSQLLEVEL
jgi:hypothetical protein